MSALKFLQLIALSPILRAQASEITFKNVTLLSASGNSTTIFESNNLSEYLPKTKVLEIIIKGRIPVLYENSVSNIKNVEKITFVANGIEEIRAGAFKNFEGVRTLVIRENNLTVIKKGTFEDLTIEQLSLIYNKIENIESGAFANLPNLKDLFLWGNRIEHLQSSVFDGLSIERLALSENLISKIPEDFFDNLKVQKIYLERTKLATIPGKVFTNNPYLKKVDLSLNEMSLVASDAFDNMPNLEEVILASNNLTKLDPQWFHNSPNINRLDFILNSLEEIPSEAFKNIIKGNFTKIDLSVNRISRILPGAFKGIRRIQFLDLSSNEIDKWDSSFLENVEQIHFLDLSSNRIKCVEGNLDDIFRANVTLLDHNLLDDECLKKIDEWNRAHSLEGRKVCTQMCQSLLYDIKL